MISLFEFPIFKSGLNIEVHHQTVSCYFYPLPKIHYTPVYIVVFKTLLGNIIDPWGFKHGEASEDDASQTPVPIQRPDWETSPNSRKEAIWQDKVKGS